MYEKCESLSNHYRLTIVYCNVASVEVYILSQHFLIHILQQSRKTMSYFRFVSLLKTRF